MPDVGEPDPADATGESLEELYEYAPCGFLSADPDGRIVKVNETLLALTGHTRDQLVGTLFIELLSIGSQLFYETRYLPVLHLEGAVREVALSFRGAKGDAIPVLVNSVLVRDTGGVHRVTRTAVFDATARQNYERELLSARREAEASEVRVRVLQKVTIAFAAATNEESVARALADTAREAFAATDVAVLLADSDGRLHLTAGHHPLADVLAQMTDRVDLHSYRSRTILAMTDYADFEQLVPGMGDALAASRVASLTITPILAEDGPLGIYVCFFGRRREFDEPMREMQESIARQAAVSLARARLGAELEHLALHDQLTGLASRRLLSERLESALAGARRSGLAVSLIFADLDGFKAINDGLGHRVGDDVLVEVADRLRSELRESDLIGRFGGDEFVAICENTDATSALALTERIRESIAAPLAAGASRFPLSASVGVAVYLPGDSGAVSPESMFIAADSAMYVSKEQGKNRTTLVRL